MNLVVQRVDVDHAEEDYLPLSLRKGLLRVCLATGIAADTELEYRLVAAAIFALLIHRHLLQTLFYGHSVVLQELLELARLSESVRSADIVGHLGALKTD